MSGAFPARLAALIALLLFSGFGSGCVYAKHVTNERVRSLETSRIVVGETTVLDVLNAWGPPAPVDPMELLNPLAPTLFELRPGLFRYVSRETRCNSFLATGPIPSAPFPIAPRLPFLWCDDQPTYVLVLEFDEAGVVKRVSKGTTEAVWRPWSSGDDRRVEVQTTSTRGMSLP